VRGRVGVASSSWCVVDRHGSWNPNLVILGLSVSDSLPLSDLVNLIVLNVIPYNRMHTDDLPCYACVGLHAFGYGLVSELNH
jgi:hypothetical protein